MEGDHNQKVDEAMTMLGFECKDGVVHLPGDYKIDLTAVNPEECFIALANKMAQLNYVKGYRDAQKEMRGAMGFATDENNTPGVVI